MTLTRLHLTMACNRYDRTMPLADGRVKAAGIDLNVIFTNVEAVFWRMLLHREFAVSEMSLSSYIMARSRGDDGLLAIPVFPSRAFRHSAIYVLSDSPLESPSQLSGLTVGVPEYQMTAAVWVKGILEDEYGVASKDILWKTGGLDQAGRIEKLPLEIPAAIAVSPIPADMTLTQCLLDGSIDALVTPRPPSAFTGGGRSCRRLLRDHRRVEREYYKRTRIFPPMHTVVMKTEVYRDNPWIAMNLYEAFDRALALCDPDDMFDGHLRYALPFLPADVEEWQADLGGLDMWRYGLADNHKTLETLIRYQAQQGLLRAPIQASDLFAPETLDRFRN